MNTQTRSLLITLISTLGFGVLFGLILGRILAKRITHPLRRLVKASRSIGAGQRDIKLPAAGPDEVGELVQAFGRMQQELDINDARLRRTERVAAWQDIARELAHEIKNPLTPIQMAIETLRRAHSRQHERFDELFTESSETILEEVARLSKIVSQFSQFARMPNPEPRQHLLNDVVRSVSILYRDHPVRVTESLDEAVGEVLIDPERMTQVVQNLVLNGVQAVEGTDRKGLIQLKTRRTSSDTVELVVEDNGPGIAPDDMPRVFTPYFTSKTGGTGLGLAVVHRIVSGHNGRIGVKSEVGQGTHFIVQLPG
jgi:nitrogen fixation/metabolism regulation signal transduction histidine kinase